MKVYAKRPNDKKGDKLPVATVRQSTATGVLQLTSKSDNDNHNVQTHNRPIAMTICL